MPYQRKTRDIFTVQAEWGQGWEDETSELTRKAARERLREYRQNAPGCYRIRKTRERIANAMHQNA
jgi:hypothetical protein